MFSHSIDPDDKRANESLTYYNKELNESIAKLEETQNTNKGLFEIYRLPYLFNPKPTYNYSFNQYEYEALCRGDYNQKKSLKLTCRYSNHAYELLIAPVKEELIHENPHIWIFHDVITDKQIEIMKNKAISNVCFFLNCRINFCEFKT